MKVSKRRVIFVTAPLLVTFAALRLFLHSFPNADFNVGRYNIHHLFTGLILITLSGIPLAVFHGEGRLLDFAALAFGIGMSLALDEWVYLIATDGTNASYLLPISFWGGVVMIALASGYALALYWRGKKGCRLSGE
jgi:hypothetical protein